MKFNPSHWTNSPCAFLEMTGLREVSDLCLKLTDNRLWAPAPDPGWKQSTLRNWNPPCPSGAWGSSCHTSYWTRKPWPSNWSVNEEIFRIECQYKHQAAKHGIHYSLVWYLGTRCIIQTRIEFRNRWMKCSTQEALKKTMEKAPKENKENIKIVAELKYTYISIFVVSSQHTCA